MRFQIVYYNGQSHLHNSIILLIEDICELSHNLNIHICCHIYKETNRITYHYLAKKVFVIMILIFDDQIWL